MALTDEGIMSIPGMLSRYVRLPNGTKAHYMTSGESGPAVVLLHGGIIGSSGQAGFRFMAPFLGAHGFRVYCPDMPGFGLTENYENAYVADETGHLEFLRDFIATVGVEKFHISGNSMGCMNAVNYITAHPDRIISYALIAGSVGDIVSHEEVMASERGRTLEAPNIAQFDGTPESMDRMMSAIIVDSSKVTDDLNEMRTRAANQHREWWERFFKSMVGGSADENTKASLRTKGRFDRMTIPGIYLYGTKDILMPHDLLGYAQEDALPNVQFFYPEDTGHQGQTDQPELFNDVFLQFFRDGKVDYELAQRAGVSERRTINPTLVAVPENVAV